MRRRVVTGLCAAVVLVPVTAGCATERHVLVRHEHTVAPPDAHQRAVAETYRAFRTALEHRAGAEVAARLTRATLERYAAIGRMAAAQGPERLSRAPAMDRYLVAALRSVARPAPDATGADVVALLVEHGLLRATAAGAGDPGTAEVEVAQGRASAPVAPGSPVRWEFRHEGGAWRLDLLPELAIGSALLESAAGARGVSVEALVEELLSVELGRPVGGEVWHPRG